jgi:hypothetical protein
MNKSPCLWQRSQASSTGFPQGRFEMTESERKLITRWPMVYRRPCRMLKG